MVSKQNKIQIKAMNEPNKVAKKRSLLRLIVPPIVS
jgi:hypothetical protein